MLRYQIIPVTPFQQNCTVFWNEETKKGGIVDPGGDLALLNKFIDEQGIEIEKILVTHGHLDHAGAATAVSERTGCPIIGPHKDDQWLLDEIEAQGAKYGIADGKNVVPTRYLDEGDTLTLGDQTFGVTHCPGHTPGHVVFFHRPSKFAVVGDVLFQGSIGRTDFPMGNHQDLIDAITKKLWPLGDDVTFIPGHGPESTFGAERKFNPYVSDASLKHD